jgi:hypothetical protein
MVERSFNNYLMIGFILAPIIIWFILMYIIFTKAVEIIPGEGGLISKIKKLKEDELKTYNDVMGAGVFLAILLTVAFGMMIFFTFPWITSFGY